jgi:hypothetical protein
MQETTTIGGLRVFYNLGGLTHLETVTLNPSYPNSGNSAYYQFISCPNLRYFVLKGIGSDSAPNAYYDKLKYWGVPSDDEPDARQSLIDSLITYSANRSGGDVQNLILSDNTKGKLTEDEKHTIQLKGYTIA